MSNRINRRTLVTGAATAAMAAGFAVPASSSAASTLQIPNTPLGRQLAWALTLFTGKPTGLTEADVKEHFAPSVLSQVPLATLTSTLDQASSQLGPITSIRFSEAPTDTSATVEVSAKSGQHLGLVIVVTGSPESLISILSFKPLASAASSVASPAAGAQIPDTPVGRQLRWFLGLLSGSPANVTANDLAAHLAPAFLTQIGANAFLANTNQLSIAQGPFMLQYFVNPPADVAAEAVVIDKRGGQYKVSISVESATPNLIDRLSIRAAPITDSWSSWDQFYSAWTQLAAKTSFFVTELGKDGTSPIAGAAETIPMAIGSTFKLYVLGALALAIEAGQMSWDDKLAIQQDWKSLPSGDFQNEPAGTEFTLRQYAEKMISISDNTAADHLLLHLGRDAVQTAMARVGHANPRLNAPFLTTREVFALKLAADNATVEEYIQANTFGRLGMLSAIDALKPTLASAANWTAPRYIDQIEWFASCNDLANAMSWLVNRGSGLKLAPVLEILSINPGVALDSKTWLYAGFKGGSEPGVLTTTWLLRSAANRTFVVSGALNDTTRALDEQTAIAAMAKAINLLAKTI